MRLTVIYYEINGTPKKAVCESKDYDICLRSLEGYSVRSAFTVIPEKLQRDKKFRIVYINRLLRYGATIVADSISYTDPVRIVNDNGLKLYYNENGELKSQRISGNTIQLEIEAL